MRILDVIVAISVAVACGKASMAR